MMAILLIIFVTVFVFVVFKELMSYGKPYSKSLNTESAVEEKGYGAAGGSSDDEAMMMNLMKRSIVRIVKN